MELLRHERRHPGRCRPRHDRMQAGQRMRPGQNLRGDRLPHAPDRPGPDEHAFGYHRRGTAITERARTGHRDRAGPVDVGDEPRRGMEPGMIRLARTERHPANRSGADGHARTDPQKGHQRRGIDRIPLMPVAVELRRPPPTPMQFDPAAVMERREPPGRVVHPGPAPGCHEGPVPVAIRHPCGVDGRIPYLPILRVAVPGAVAGKLAATRQPGDCRRRRDRMCRGRRRHRRTVSGQFRPHEFVRCGLSQNPLERVRPADRQRLPGRKRLRHARRGHGRAARQHHHDRGGGCVARDHADLPRLARRHRPAWRHQRPRLVRRQVLWPQKALALR